ncbi:MAG TPA: response regulator, partial [Chitinophagaceae bacterium]|nr:response regulator [Chitinophagaceae bacterium]
MNNILWIDDEVDSLKSQILFLENKGYQVAAMSNGYDGIEHLKDNTVDAILLDETMPGMTGMETLEGIRTVNQQIPVIMVTKNEAEDVMEDAIGRQINDYLIKPVNPNQVLLALKKNIDNKRLVAEKTTTAYQQDFRNLFMTLSSSQDYNEWRDTYKKLVHWELQMAKSDSPEMQDVFNSQKAEANTEFAKYVMKNYKDWVHPQTPEAPIMSHTLFRYKIAPHIEKGKPLFVVLIDNLRFDQWKVIEPIFAEYFSLEEEDTFYSILPTATQYCRNAIFAGMMPVEIEKKFPMEWKNDNEQGGKNLHEEKFLGAQLESLNLEDIRYSYTKVTNHQSGQN